MGMRTKEILFDFFFCKYFTLLYSELLVNNMYSNYLGIMYKKMMAFKLISFHKLAAKMPSIIPPLLK